MTISLVEIIAAVADQILQFVNVVLQALVLLPQLSNIRIISLVLHLEVRDLLALRRDVPILLLRVLLKLLQLIDLLFERALPLAHLVFA